MSDTRLMEQVAEILASGPRGTLDEWLADMPHIFAAFAAGGLVVTTKERAAIGAAVERLPDDFAWKVDYMPPPNEVAFFVYCYNRYGTGPTLPEAIAAALEEPTDE